MLLPTESWKGYSGAGVHSVRISPNGKLVAYGSYQKILLQELEKPGLPRPATQQSPNTGATSSVVARPSLAGELRGHSGWVLVVAWCPNNNKHLASGSGDRTVKLWNVETTQCLWSTIGGHSRWVYALAWRFAMAPTGDSSFWIASGSDDGTVRVWEGSDGRSLELHNHGQQRVYAVCWSTDGVWLMSGLGDGTITLRSTDSEHPTSQSRTRALHGHSSIVWSLDCTKDGAWLASGSSDNTVRLWSLNAVGKHQVLCSNEESSVAFVARFVGTASIRCVKWSNDATWVAAGSSDHMISVWHVRSKSCWYTWKGHSNIVASLDWTPAGECLVSASYDGTVKVWRAIDRFLFNLAVDEVERDVSRRLENGSPYSSVTDVDGAEDCAQRLQVLGTSLQILSQWLETKGLS